MYPIYFSCPFQGGQKGENAIHTFFGKVYLRSQDQILVPVPCVSERTGMGESTAISQNVSAIFTSAVVDTMFVDIYVDTKNIPTCRYSIQHIDKRTMEK